MSIAALKSITKSITNLFTRNAKEQNTMNQTILELARTLTPVKPTPDGIANATVNNSTTSHVIDGIAVWVSRNSAALSYSGQSVQECQDTIKSLEEERDRIADARRMAYVDTMNMFGGPDSFRMMNPGQQQRRFDSDPEIKAKWAEYGECGLKGSRIATEIEEARRNMGTAAQHAKVRHDAARIAAQIINSL